jgi:hypothetical protein
MQEALTIANTRRKRWGEEEMTYFDNRSPWLLPMDVILNGYIPRTRKGSKYWMLLDRRARCNLFVQILRC